MVPKCFGKGCEEKQNKQKTFWKMFSIFDDKSLTKKMIKTKKHNEKPNQDTNQKTTIKHQKLKGNLCVLK